MRYTMGELESMLAEVCALQGLPCGHREPGGLFIRTRDSRVGGVEVTRLGLEGRGWHHTGISGTKGEVGAMLGAALWFAERQREAREG